ncbi:MAG: ATP-binding cassette domain-containing protein [Anaerolineae bacterium]|nr:ATP-binding cassette domain-containing protein [Anaerolineae bacterium]
MIDIVHLSKTYANGTHALRDITATLDVGVVGLIGPNGAGKTTLMRILATLLRPTQGTARVFGFSIDDNSDQQAIRATLGYLPQTPGVHIKLSVEQNLDYFAILKRISYPQARRHEIDRVIDQTGLLSCRRERAEVLSGGMKRRLGIAIALLNNPKLIIVDEPTAGLDPVERVRFRNILASLAGERLVILSTHIVEDLQQVGNTIVILHEGRILFQGSPRTLMAQARGHIWALERKDSALDRLDSNAMLSVSEQDGKLMQRMIADTPPSSLACSVEPSLEDAYLYIMHRKALMGEQTSSLPLAAYP